MNSITSFTRQVKASKLAQSVRNQHRHLPVAKTEHLRERNLRPAEPAQLTISQYVSIRVGREISVITARFEDNQHQEASNQVRYLVIHH